MFVVLATIEAPLFPAPSAITTLDPKSVLISEFADHPSIGTSTVTDARLLDPNCVPVRPAYAEDDIPTVVADDLKVLSAAGDDDCTVALPIMGDVPKSSMESPDGMLKVAVPPDTVPVVKSPFICRFAPTLLHSKDTPVGLPRFTNDGVYSCHSVTILLQSLWDPLVHCQILKCM